MKQSWLVDHCALCGDPFPLTSPLYANMSRTMFQNELPCPCETRKPPVAEVPKKSLSELTPEEVEQLLAVWRNGRPAFGATVDRDP